MWVDIGFCATGTVDCVDWDGEVAVGDRSEGVPLVGKLTYAGFNLSMETESVICSLRSVKYTIRSIIWLLQWFLDCVVTHKYMGCRTEGIRGVSC